MHPRVCPRAVPTDRPCCRRPAHPQPAPHLLDTPRALASITSGRAAVSPPAPTTVTILGSDGLSITWMLKCSWRNQDQDLFCCSRMARNPFHYSASSPYQRCDSVRHSVSTPVLSHLSPRASKEDPRARPVSPRTSCS
ncbi:hypothetical protein FA95DRAFT_1306963 [Auriscalpium vulgare]|uniref:Uncharacterized protein n=1 Tax=Auriscalpium vulgare TaxID=40419 RepID=A0ACB8RTL3_9AGAM|nr:hypothetical protein FA95DRAFT_1306963 [Auriscalpium vulgare]